VILKGLRGIGLDYGTGGIRGVMLRASDRGGRSRPVRHFTGPLADADAAGWLSGEDSDRPVVLPSGFGVPVRRLQDLEPDDLFEVTLRRHDPVDAGLGAFLSRVAASRPDAFLIPAVKQLPTVPRHRKVNRVDMGTSDKLCAAALAVWLLAGGDGGRFGTVDSLCLEIGTGFKAWVVVAGGQVVDGIGGTAGTLGPRARGALDGEFAYLHPPSRKAEIYGGGAADLDAAFPGRLGERALWEGVEREAAMLTRFYGIDRIVAAGRRREEAIARLGDAGYRVEALPDGPDLPAGDRGVAGLEAALGAAILADGLGGGRAAELVGHLGLTQATDRVMRYVWTAP
jgi:predicted butyrate kinase (DUF1464 family)